MDVAIYKDRFLADRYATFLTLIIFTELHTHFVETTGTGGVRSNSDRAPMASAGTRVLISKEQMRVF